MLRRSRLPNSVQARVEIDNLNRRDGRWVRLNEEQVLVFPRLDMDYLKDLTIGVYQLDLSLGYIQDKFARERTVNLEIDDLFDEPGLIRIRVRSRYRNQTKYQIWIFYNPHKEDQEPIEN